MNPGRAAELTPIWRQHITPRPLAAGVRPAYKARSVTGDLAPMAQKGLVAAILDRRDLKDPSLKDSSFKDPNKP
jgi:hypothetical protein